jgi:hypothetical protein
MRIGQLSEVPKIAKDRPKLEGKTLPLMNADTADLKKE